MVEHRKRSPHPFSAIRTFAAQLLPGKHDYWDRLFLKLLYLILVAALIAAPVASGVRLSRFARQQKTAERFLQAYDSADPDARIEALQRLNPDACGWLKIGAIDLQLPVFKRTDADFYRRHDALQKRNGFGAAVLTQSGSEQTGPRWTVTANATSGAPFESLQKLRDSRIFTENPAIVLETADGSFSFRIFAIMVVDRNDTDFEKETFPEKSDYKRWLSALRRKSFSEAKFYPAPEDRILTLVCDADDFDGARLVLMASTAENGGLTVNPYPQFCEQWYAAHGLGGSDTEKE